MPPTSPGLDRPANKILARLPDEDFQRIQPHLVTQPMRVKAVLHTANERMRHVYFPNGGVVSVTSIMNDGRMVEVATVGHEGLIGVDVLFGAERAGGETMVQVPDTSVEAMLVEAFRTEVERRGAFHDAVHRYAQGFIGLTMQSVGCMALHAVQPRCCRWLLMAHDRVGRDEFHLSHEFLAMMLGATRPTVTAVAGVLQKAGLIRYVHGRITILDRTNLENASCECYATVKSRFDQLGL